MNFQVGDKVKWCGLEGVVKSIDYSEDKYPIKVEFGKDVSVKFDFTIDGKSWVDHPEPSLILVERPKKKVKKTFYQAIVKSNLHPWLCSDLFDSEESLQSYEWDGCGLIVIGIHKIELEVEE